MTKKYIPYIGTSLAIIIVGAILFFNVQKTHSPEENEGSKTNTGVTQNLANTDTKTDSESMNLWEKFSEGEKVNLKCEFDTEQEGGKVKQIVYISSPNIRMDMNVTHEAGNSESHMFTDGVYTYVWGSNGPAFKMKNIDPSKTEKENNANTSTPDDAQNLSKSLEQIPYNKCSEWTVDSSIFKIPDGIEFTDMETFQKDMMEQATKGMTEDEINQLKSSMPKIN